MVTNEKREGICYLKLSTGYFLFSSTIISVRKSIILISTPPTTVVLVLESKPLHKFVPLQTIRLFLSRIPKSNYPFGLRL